MKLRVLLIASAFLVAGGTAMAFANNWGGQELASPIVTSEAKQDTQLWPVDTMAVVAIGVVGLGAARRHLSSAK